MTSASQQTQAHSAHTPSASASTDPSSPEDLIWEGDRMFNIYIWDYCVKRGYSNTARELAEEAKLNPNPRPPIDAKQGLLYEWWCVFWVLFSAKSNNNGSEDAMVYIQNHMAQARMHQVPGAMPRFANGLPRLPGGPGSVPNSLGAGVPQHPGHPSQPPSAHPMPNGIGPTSAGQQQTGQPLGHGPSPHQQTPGHQQPPQAPPPLGFPQPHQPQTNGVPAHGRPPMVGQGQPGPGAGQSGRPQLPFYPSPTMAHQQTGGGPPPPYSGLGPMSGGLPPNSYPQHMRPMFPPGAAPNGIGGVTGSSGFPPNPAGTGSRAPTPGQPAGSNITQPSPGMAHRAVPATPPNFGGPSVPGGRGGPAFDQVNQLNAEIQKIDGPTLNKIRQEIGLGNKEPIAMTIEEKSRLLNAFNQQRNAPGPSNQARPQQGRGSKRNSVSPGDAHAEIPAKDEPSPPQKRVRRSPEQPAASGPSPAGNPPQGGPSNANPSGGMYPPPNVMPNGMRPGGPPFTPHMAPMSVGQGGPSGMMMHGPHPGMAGQQMPQFQKNPNQAYMQAMHNKMGAADSQQMQQPQFGPDPNQGRPAPPPFGGQRQGVPQGKMLPPSSPATSTNANGQGKSPQNSQGKAESGVKMENSPRTGPPPPQSGSTGPSPPTPGPSAGQMSTSAPSPSLSNQSRPTTSTSNPTNGGAAGSGSAPPLPPPPASAPPGQGSVEQIAGIDFMATAFDDFTTIFGRDEPNFDFGMEGNFSNWFSSDITGMTDMK